MTAVDIRFCGRLVYLFFDFHASFCDLGFIALDKNVDFSSPKLTSKTEVFKLANHIYIYIYIYIYMIYDINIYIIICQIYMKIYMPNIYANDVDYRPNNIA